MSKSLDWFEGVSSLSISQINKGATTKGLIKRMIEKHMKEGRNMLAAKTQVKVLLHALEDANE